LSKPAQAGGTGQKSQDESKAVPVKALYFDKLVRFPGYAGASTQLMTGRPEVEFGSTGVTYVTSIFLYRGEFCVDGRFFVPMSAGTILAYEF
jgi:hypothetical protein